ncbi:hypothetical protein [Chamaesiphon polymorphus]|uniref:hypothetical protein n=1 Tax=Chamaesiphon polymorphus TaxID=2107691 RepID=UPI0015E6F052|nr:hypothetical protein [Chamaesiphon polymorphus]
MIFHTPETPETPETPDSQLSPPNSQLPTPNSRHDSTFTYTEDCWLDRLTWI